MPKLEEELSIMDKNFIEKCNELEIALEKIEKLKTLLIKIAPSWLPEGIRDERHQILKEI